MTRPAATPCCTALLHNLPHTENQTKMLNLHQGLKLDKLQQPTNLEKRIQSLKADLAQMQENISALYRYRQTTETERDKRAKELISTSSKGALDIDKNRRLNARTAALEGKQVAALGEANNLREKCWDKVREQQQTKHAAGLEEPLCAGGGE